jgi:hypothetical protein
MKEVALREILMDVQCSSSWPQTAAHLKDEIGITAGQSVAWDMFVYTVGAQAASVLENRGHGLSPSPRSAADSRDEQTEQTARWLKVLRTVERAADGLYAILTPVQRRRADGVLRVLCGGLEGDAVAASGN